MEKLLTLMIIILYRLSPYRESRTTISTQFEMGFAIYFVKIQSGHIEIYEQPGSAAHINIDSHLSKEQYIKLLTYAGEVGCKYLTFNVPNAECQECGFITKTPITKCPYCGSTKIDYYDRVIGYLTKIKNWSAGRQQEQKTRIYSHID